ncbi:RnfABCDGE type electron transport complex subunit D [Clostridium tagluense]|uniref:RnfABCDGE type electron transport complex subunit D n=1 Tax=Clostridium TaxID=1485 RepID=UPI0013E98809|nr:MULTISPECIES: RnfABCDGE type electron transport complex subunit D [Clostridium]MBU3128249.1 RnfABCDGE type electron transport complex subunit D [Clostridium tagluense]MBW9157866.1 RnfABCDGE type electron transport complex subunit D [Clostridium tagluense]MBZ9622772.1 RnfABCDGE type electron transport complex subunit D [Clostridium sp. FP2]MBZ9634314.1 RnfABCDGE type electron transport complex subunit D [Clostridium sp. FP1]MCB2310741.1 RnfABCDGE type electron transport complex subunit D [Cl
MNSEVKLEDNLFTISTSPHIRGKESISKIMWTVNLALAPAALFAIYNFGIPALITLLVGSLSAVGLEYLVQKLRKKPITISDGSAFLTGLLLAMCLPPTIPPYMAIVGSFIAIVIAKHSMGGLGYNIFNPAHIGRAAIMVSWPVAMTTWSKLSTSVDVVTTATPLNILKQQGYGKLIDTFGSVPQMYKAMFIGTRNGSIGETSTVLLLLGGIYLIYKGYVNWHVPVFMIGTVGILTWVFGPVGLFTGDPVFHMMAGGLIIGAFFMATDMVTIPITKKGQVIFAIGAGALTVLIRLKGGYPEGVCYSILLMNAVTPLIDRLVRPVKFGARR